MDKVLAANPSLIAILSASNSATTAVKTARQRKFPGLLIGMSVVDPQGIIAAIGMEQARGVGLVQEMPNPRAPLLAVAQDFRRALQSTDQAVVANSLLACLAGAAGPHRTAAR